MKLLEPPSPNTQTRSAISPFRTLAFTQDRELLVSAIGRLVAHVQQTKPDTIIFLDKSARIYAHVFQESWRQLSTSKPNHQILFCNIGREKNLLLRDPTGKFIEDYAEAFRQTYRQNCLFEGKKILIVDDDVASGATLESARKVLFAAYPNVKLIETCAVLAPETFQGSLAFEPVRTDRGGDLWHSLPKLPCGDEQGLTLVPETIYLAQRKKEVRELAAQLSLIDDNVDRIPLFEKYFDSNVRFYSDYLLAHSDVACRAFTESGCDELQGIFFERNKQSSIALLQPTTRKRCPTLDFFITTWEFHLETEMKMLTVLEQQSQQRMADWRVAVEEAHLIARSPEERKQSNE